MAEDEHNKDSKPGSETNPGGNPKKGEGDPIDDHVIEKRKEIEKDYVPRSKYEKAVDRYNKLYDRILEEGRVEVKVDSTKKEDQPVGPTDKELREKLTKGNNVEFWVAALELRKRELDKGHPDIFVTNGFDKYGRALKPEPGEEEGVKNNVKVIEECIEMSKREDGTYDNNVFSAEMTKRAR